MKLISRRSAIAAFGAISLAGCSTIAKTRKLVPEGTATSSLDVFSDGLFDLIDESAQLETLSTGYQWAEGPTWDAKRQQLYFTDVPQNKAFVWSESRGTEVFLDPSGITSDQATGFREPGANGLLMTPDGRLLLCNHGTRSVQTMDIDSRQRTALASTYDGQRFNSPNDLVRALDGTIYFTDPPYGLEGLNNSPLKDMRINGVYRLRDDIVDRLIDDMTFPNGIGLTPDEKSLLISQSDPDAPIIRKLDLETGKSETWFDAAPFMTDGPGLPDGMAVAESGHVFATGPGGVLIIAPDGEPLGRINPGRACANCAFGEDGRTLFLTAQDSLMRIRTNSQGLGFGS